MTPYRVLLADGEALFRQGLARLLRDVGMLEVVADAADAAEALQQVRAQRPDVAVIDARLLGSDGAETIDLLKQESPNLRVVVLLASDDDPDLLCAVQTGADACVAKSAPADALIRSILGVMDGEAVLSRGTMRRLIALTGANHVNGRWPVRSRDLSAREQQILRMVAAGSDNHQIAERLGVTESTVRNHLHNVYDKLGLETRVQLALYAFQQGIVP